MSKRGTIMSAVVFVVAALAILSAFPAAAQNVQTGPIVIQELKHDTSPPVRSMPLVAPQPAAHRVLLPLFPGPAHIGSEPDGVLQRFTTPLVGTTNLLNFAGVSDRDGVAPSDSNASVGATQVVETVNTSYQVFNKTTGTSAFGPVEVNIIFTGFGGLCETGLQSDPIVLYDKAAGRWLISQVVFNSSLNSFDECIAVSTTSDATGSYNRYAFSFGNTLNDYPKFGVWPDAYYASYNMFFLAAIFTGPQVCAYDRTAMLAGSTATAVCFQRGTSDFSFLPSDLDGSTLPPTGETNFFLELGTSTTLDLFKFHVDFVTPTNSTFTGPTTLTVSFYTDACAATGTCIPQKNTTQQLDSLGNRLMYRLAYRNFTDHESLVATHSIASGSSTGVRWYEIRSPSATSPVVFQSGTFAPDSNFRWMPSIGMDKAGDIAVGYSVSSSTTFPTIAYTGRLASDTLGTLESEATIFTGLGSQNGGLSRWGDYSSISIDPVDDCTFWYTNQYLPATGSFNWNTREASFNFPSCVSTTPDFSLSATPSSQTVVVGSSTTYTATVAALNGFAGTVTFSASGLPTGATASFSPTSVTGSGSSTMTVTTSSTTPAGTSTLTITGTSGTLVHSTTVTLVVTSGVADFSISATPASQTVKRGFRTTYTVTIGALNGFTGTVSFSVKGLPSHTSTRFNPTTVTGSGTSTLTVGTTSSTSTGTFTLTITGTSGTLVHSTTVTLIVTT